MTFFFFQKWKKSSSHSVWGRIFGWIKPKFCSECRSLISFFHFLLGTWYLELLVRWLAYLHRIWCFLEFGVIPLKDIWLYFLVWGICSLKTQEVFGHVFQPIMLPQKWVYMALCMYVPGWHSITKANWLRLEIFFGVWNRDCEKQIETCDKKK